MRISKALSVVFLVALICIFVLLAVVHLSMGGSPDAVRLKTILVSLLPFLLLFYVLILPAASGWTVLAKTYKKGDFYTERLVKVSGFVNSVFIRGLKAGTTKDGLILKAPATFITAERLLFIPWADLTTIEEKNIKAVYPPQVLFDRQYMQLHLAEFSGFFILISKADFERLEIGAMYNNFVAQVS